MHAGRKNVRLSSRKNMSFEKCSALNILKMVFAFTPGGVMNRKITNPFVLCEWVGCVGNYKSGGVGTLAALGRCCVITRSLPHTAVPQNRKKVGLEWNIGKIQLLREVHDKFTIIWAFYQISGNNLLTAIKTCRRIPLPSFLP